MKRKNRIITSLVLLSMLLSSLVSCSEKETETESNANVGTKDTETSGAVT